MRAGPSQAPATLKQRGFETGLKDQDNTGSFLTDRVLTGIGLRGLGV